MSGTVTRILNSMRYQPGVSALARTALGPLRSICRRVADEIENKIWINGGRVVFDGFEIRFPQNVGVLTATSLYWRQSYERNTWRVLRRLVPDARHLIDVGSNIGIFSVLSRKLHPELEVDAFEPIPWLYEQNVAFHRHNGFGDSRIHEMALGDSRGEATLLVPEDPYRVGEVSSATLRPDSWQARKDSTERITVEVSTLDSHFEGQTVGRPLVIKIDVEDFEAAVLRGGRKLLAEHRPWIVCEILPREHGNRETLGVLREGGYEVFALTDPGLYRLLDGDFAPERRPLEFLLAPQEKVSAARSFLSWEELSAGSLMG